MCLLTKRTRPTLAVLVTDSLIEKPGDRMQMPELNGKKKRLWARGNVVKGMWLLTKRTGLTLAVHFTDALIEKAADRMQMPEWEKEWTMWQRCKENVFTDKTGGNHSRRPCHRRTDDRIQMPEWEKEMTFGPRQRCKENVFTDKTGGNHSRRPRHRLTDRKARRQNADAWMGKRIDDVATL